MKSRLMVFLSLTLYLTAWGQPPDSLWSRTYGGQYWDGCYAMCATADGGFLLAGSTESFSISMNGWIVKTSPAGDSLWARRFGGTYFDEFYAIAPAGDGGFVAAGVVYQAQSSDIWLCKVDAAGDSLWSSSLGDSQQSESAADIVPAENGGFIVAATTADSRSLIVRTDDGGDSIWSRPYGAENCIYLASTIEPVFGGGYIVGGTMGSSGPALADFWLMKIDASGDSLWSRQFGGAGIQRGYAALQSSDHGFLIAGATYGDEGNAAIWVVKTDSTGDSLWSRSFGPCLDDAPVSIVECAEGGFLITATSDPGRDFLLVKISSDGDSLWSRTFGGNNGQKAQAVLQTLDGGFAVAGYQWSSTGLEDFWLLKTTPEFTETDDFAIRPSSFSLSAYPNPFNATTQIRFDLPRAGLVNLNVYDVTGRLVENLASRVYAAGTHSMAYDASAHASGTYLVRMTSGDFSRAQKIMLLK